MDLSLDQLTKLAQEFETVLEKQKSAIAPTGFGWYPYGSLNNFHILGQLLADEFPDLFQQLPPGPIVDIGSADGDTAFFLESLGFEVDVIDNAPTNFNGCRGVRALREALDSHIAIHEVDLDQQFQLPRQHYSLAFFLGILYHLKNPFYALERLAQQTRYLLLSTRIARFNRNETVPPANGVNPLRFDMSGSPIAYLVAPDETNNDATNFWIFSNAGLQRLLQRTGWDILAYQTFGAVGESDPASQQGDERAFCLAVSRHHIG